MKRLLVLLAACGGGAHVATDAAAPDPIPADTVPCDAPQYWPLALRSDAVPVVVHYRSAEEETMARDVLGYVEHSWEIETGPLHFRPPIDDAGRCGDDGDFDVYLWRGEEECYVDVVAENPATAWDDEVAYLVVDPWGPYGGPILDTTVAHELDHAMQAADDWSDAPLIYEATSAFIEDEVYDDDNEYVDQIVDFQAHPEWSVDRDDGYATWYMYGASLYLRFVRDRYFAGDASFIGDLWLGLRSPADDNEPDFEDAFDQLLPTPFKESVPEFARWRYYTGAHDDGAHFEEGASFAEPTRAATIGAAGGSVPLSIMTYGSSYVDVAAGLTASLTDASSAVDWRLDTSVPGTVIVTVLPIGAGDPDDRTDTLHHATLVLAP